MKVQLDHTIYKVDEQVDHDIHSISFSGDIKVDTAFFYRSSSKELSKEHQELIDNIVTKGLNFDKGKVLVINLELSKVKSFGKISRFFELKNVVLLGIKPSELALNLDIKKNDVVNFNGKKLLFTDTLDSFMNDKEAKISFWVALQRMFNLK